MGLCNLINSAWSKVCSMLSIVNFLTRDIEVITFRAFGVTRTALQRYADDAKNQALIQEVIAIFLRSRSMWIYR